MLLIRNHLGIECGFENLGKFRDGLFEVEDYGY